jgi:hypothetical protein
MGNCNDYDRGLAGSIEDIEGKPLKNELACAVIGEPKCVWGFSNSGYGFVYSLRKCDSAQWAAFLIPNSRGAKSARA